MYPFVPMFWLGKSETNLLLLSILFPLYFPLWQLFCCLDLGYVCVCVCVCVCVFRVKFRKFSRYDFPQWFWTVSFSFIDPSKVETNFVCLLLLILFFFPFSKRIGGVEYIFCVHPTCHLPLCSFLFLCILAEFFKLFLCIFVVYMV